MSERVSEQKRKYGACPLDCYESVDETVCDECPFKGLQKVDIHMEQKVWRLR